MKADKPEEDNALNIISNRLDNFEGYLDNHDKLLTNHMHDYAVKQEQIQTQISALTAKLEKELIVLDTKLQGLRSFLTWGLGILFSLLSILIVAYIGLAFKLFDMYMSSPK